MEHASIIDLSGALRTSTKRKRAGAANPKQEESDYRDTKRTRKSSAAKAISGSKCVDLTQDDDQDFLATTKHKKRVVTTPGQKGEKRLSRYVCHRHIDSQSGLLILARFRSQPPQSFNDYYYRATSQRMFVLDRCRGPASDCPHGTADCPSETMQLAGSTGNVYTVTVTHKPTCTCPNFIKGNPQCKHIVFALVKVLKAPAELQYQLAFLTSELHELFAHAGPLPTETVNEDDKQGKRHPVEGDCAICCEELDTQAEEIVWCKAACGNNLHKSCFDQWAATKRNGQVTCPYCRTPWSQDDGALKAALRKKDQVGKDGYVNVAKELGISGHRDYSTYHSYWVRRQVRQGLVPGQYGENF
ncbi:hypothetical protein ANO11243_009160 [Dothideomycetidae sp. 11243]|nr:hypothetical protein ANO11243_009160 [fungal sp. No.11243]